MRLKRKQSVRWLFLAMLIAIATAIVPCGSFLGIKAKAADTHTLKIICQKEYTNASGLQTETFNTFTEVREDGAFSIILPRVYGFRADRASSFITASASLTLDPYGVPTLDGGLIGADADVTVTYVPDSEYVYRGRSFWYKGANLMYQRAGEDIKVRLFAPDYKSYSYNETAAGYKATPNDTVLSVSLNGTILNPANYQVAQDPGSSANQDLLITIPADEIEKILLGTRPAGWKAKGATAFPLDPELITGFEADKWTGPETNFPGSTISWPSASMKQMAEDGMFTSGTMEIALKGGGKISSNIYMLYTHMADVNVANIPDQTLGDTPAEPALNITDPTRLGYSLIKNKDYTVSFTGNNAVGEATATITGIGDYAGVITKTFQVKPAQAATTDIDDTTISSIPSITYNGNPQKPSVTITDPDKGGAALKEGTDYELEYKNNKDAGTATIVIKGKGDYSGEREINFVINRAPITMRVNPATKVIGEADPSYTVRIDGLINNADANNLRYTFSRTPGEALGVYIVNVMGDRIQGNYEITFGTGTLRIEEAASTKHRLTINYVYESGAIAATSFYADYGQGEMYAITSPSISGYTPNIPAVRGTMGANSITTTVTYYSNYVPNPNPTPATTSHTLTINYVYEDGKAATTPYSSKFNQGSTYAVTSPVIDGYLADKTTVSGVMPGYDYIEKVTYRKASGNNNQSNNQNNNQNSNPPVSPSDPANNNNNSQQPVNPNNSNNQNGNGNQYPAQNQTNPSNTTDNGNNTATVTNSSNNNGTAPTSVAVATDTATPPKTGDNSNVFLWIAIAAGCITGIIVFIRKARKSTDA